MPTEIYYIRHGESTGNPTGRFYDSPEALLTSEGKKQAYVAGRRMRELGLEHVNVVYCSPWERARETCKIALSASGISYHAVVFDERLRERSFAGIVGKRINSDGESDFWEDAISFQEYQEIWTYDSPIHKKFGIETLSSLEERTGSFLGDLSKWHPDETVLVFSHGGLGRMMQAFCEGWPEGGLFNSIRFLENGEIAEWEYEGK